MCTDTLRHGLPDDSEIFPPRKLISGIKQLADGLGLTTCRPFSAALLKPEARIRSFCRDNRCGRFGRHHMCPEAIGSVEECAARLARFVNGFLVQGVYELDVRSDPDRVLRSKVDFHQKILEVEAALQENVPGAWGLTGGDCALCDPCFAAQNAPCPRPDRARPSLESLAVDVMGLLAALGLDTGFHTDRVTWTGCVLF